MKIYIPTYLYIGIYFFKCNSTNILNVLRNMIHILNTIVCLKFRINRLIIR